MLKAWIALAFMLTVQPVAALQPPSEKAMSKELTGKVIAITDGDTIDILTADKAKIRIRLNNIDAPEKGQPFGNNAKQFLSDHLGGKEVRVVTHGEDRYERTIGDVYADGSLINLEIVRAAYGQKTEPTSKLFDNQVLSIEMSLDFIRQALANTTDGIQDRPCFTTSAYLHRRRLTSDS